MRKKTILILALTAFLIVGLGASCIVYDAFAAQEEGATISEVIKDVWESTPWVVLILSDIGFLITGFFMGHFFASQKPKVARGLTLRELEEAVDYYKNRRRW